ncbi:hypothetical protein IJG71_00775 [Candidatus Saccharibacteria bacterium]|nr:hypothetical protein [Candidatus Saccharibacteria bacterium]
MNKRYMDFVPSKPKAVKKSVRQVSGVAEKGQMTTVLVPEKQRGVGKGVTTMKSLRGAKNLDAQTRVEIARTMKVSFDNEVTGDNRSEYDYIMTPGGIDVGGSKVAESEVVLGVIEDLNPKFTMTDIPKRPLGGVVSYEPKNNVTEVKAKKVGVREKKIDRGSDKVNDKAKVGADRKTFNVPKSPFVNTNKIEKRPLSKNVYQKKIEAPKEEAKGPVTIIAKPEKDAHVGLIIAVILTIILGAAAGTIAFLLLPK